MPRLLPPLALVIASFATTASAADLALRGTMPPPASPPFSWDGAHVGIFGGAFWGDTNTVTDVQSASLAAIPAIIPAVNAAGSNAMTLRGAMAGVEAGYDLALGDSYVLGVQGDFSAPPLSSSRLTMGIVPFFNGLFAFDQRARADWLATVRGRVGLTPSSDTMIYATGGLAVTHLSYSSHFADVFNEFQDFRLNGAKVGWTVGAGIERQINPNWAVKLEYLYTEFARNSGIAYSVLADGSVAHVNNHLDPLQIHSVRAGVNYRWGGGSFSPLIARN